MKTVVQSDVTTVRSAVTTHCHLDTRFLLISSTFKTNVRRFPRYRLFFQFSPLNLIEIIVPNLALCNSQLCQNSFCPHLSSQRMFMGDVSVTKLYRQTDRHNKANSRFSQFCEKCLKLLLLHVVNMWNTVFRKVEPCSVTDINTFIHFKCTNTYDREAAGLFVRLYVVMC